MVPLKLGGMHSKLWCVLWAGWLLLGPAAAHARPDQHFQRGLELMRALEFERALEALDKALANPANTPADRALILVHRGIIQGNQMQLEAAIDSFQQALDADSSVRPPDSISPKLMELFKEVQKRQQEIAPAPPPTQPVAPPEPRPEPAPDPPPEPSEASTNWPAWITLGVGLAAGGAGTALGVLSRGSRSKAEDVEVPYLQAKEHLDRANTQALAANILFIAAGATAVASGILFYLGWNQQEDFAATLAPTPSGMMLQLELLR